MAVMLHGLPFPVTAAVLHLPVNFVFLLNFTGIQQRKLSKLKKFSHFCASNFQYGLQAENTRRSRVDVQDLWDKSRNDGHARVADEYFQKNYLRGFQ